MKNPDECQNMEDIRKAIDEIDKKVISLIAQRAEYVYSAAKFKTDKTSIKADERVKAMLQKRAEWATEKNLNRDIILKIYAELVNFFINEEMTRWEKANKNT